MERRDIVIIGGGPAGLSAAIAARKAGAEDVVILERDQRLGGILNQCIHNGFGLHRYREELTGPEYAQRLIDEANELNIERRTGVMAIDLSPERIITYTGRECGLAQMQAKAVVLAMGCRERPRGALNIPGTRPAGIYSAGAAQQMINMEGRMPGKEIVILGSGDIGLIMARRLTLEGAHVQAVAELMPKSGGLQRNIVQCLNDFGIPLLLSHTVVEIKGKERLEGVVLAQVDEKLKPIPGSEQEIACDTLLLSVGLLPENELSEQAGIEIDPVVKGPFVYENLETQVEGVFACGNVLHVHDLVDKVSEEAENAGRAAWAYASGKGSDRGEIHRFAPIRRDENFDASKITCIRCPKGCRISVEKTDEGLKISGNGCKLGEKYARQEFTAPMRVITTSVRCGGEMISVKTDEIPKAKMLEVQAFIRSLQVNGPVQAGDVLCSDLLGTGARLIATRSNQK